ncbi:MAG: transketolase [Gammaproteobacteria bacterium]|nr:transketolase [Gammaproteobacteria bacterium]
MKADSLRQLVAHGQSYWLDNLTRHKIASGELERRVREHGLRGVTSNPAIFHQAISSSRDYDDEIRDAFAAGRTAAEVHEAVMVSDVRDACDVLRPVYDESGGVDGYVSLEVSPHLAHDTQASIEEARRLHAAVNRPNLFIKIPGTLAGLPAIEQCLFEGININITLLFSVPRYEAVAEAWLRALERRLEAGKPVAGIASVASFFLSRIDILADSLLAHRFGTAHEAQARSLLGKVAVANAKLAYQRFKHMVASERWQKLAAQGAQVQRLLWASTSTKNPDYRDVMYVEPLIGPHTVNTLPDKTITAFADHGQVATTLEDSVDDARQTMAALDALGIDFAQLATHLENEGVQKFIEPYDALTQLIEDKGRLLQRREGAEMLPEATRLLRRQVLRMTTEAGSGHPTSCLSCAEIVAALFFHEMRWDPADPQARNVDRFVLSKGHAAPILWAALAAAGAIEEDPMSLRRIDSTLEGHPTPNNPWIKVATGSLGQGLSAANGMALANRLDGIDARVFCLLGDGECSEGSVWEAAQFASLNKLANLVAIVDVNGLGQSGPAPYGHDTAVLARRFESFGWRAIEIHGHDMDAVLDALERAREGGPTAILACTVKGRGVSFLEGAGGWHGKPVERERLQQALDEVGDVQSQPRVEPRRSGAFETAIAGTPGSIDVNYASGAEVATREAYGHALAKLGALNPDIVALDGDVKNSTRSEFFAEAFPERFFECWIAEQNMVGAALGLAACGKIPFVSTFACFLSRAYDFIRMAGHSRPQHLVFCGSHAGVSIGEDGPSQMGLEDLAMFRALAHSTVLYPCDAVSAERLTEQAARSEGIVYLRTTRGKTPVIYGNDERFPVGGSKVLRASGDDQCTVVAAGVTVHEALAAHDSLKQQGIALRVIDAYSVKPLDVATLIQAAGETRGLVVVEDHWADGGLGDAVARAHDWLVPLRFLAVGSEPRSGTPHALLERHGISRHVIVQQVLALVNHPDAGRLRA